MGRGKKAVKAGLSNGNHTVEDGGVLDADSDMKEENGLNESNDLIEKIALEEETEERQEAEAISDGEYIVLNRQDTDIVEGQEHTLAEYMALPRQQYFDCDSILKSMRLTQAVTRKGERLCRENKIRLDKVVSGFVDGKDETVGEAIGEGIDGRNSFRISILFDRESALHADCQCPECRRHYYSQYYRKEYCAYLAGLMLLAQKRLQVSKMGDATDKNAALLIRAFCDQRVNHVISDAIGKKETLTLSPRVIQKNDALTVSFKIGEKKLFVIKDLFEFYQNVQEGTMASYGSSTSFNHHISNFVENSRKWIHYIGRIVREEQAFARRLMNTQSYSKKALSKGGELELFGWRLDEFWQLAGEDSFEFENRDSDRKQKQLLRAEERNPRIAMRIRKNTLKSRKSFYGVTVDCSMPQLFYGVKTAYYIQDDILCRVQEEFQQRIRTIARFCRYGGMTFQVGEDMLSEFYYSVLPQLEGVADIIEEDAEEIAAHLPPQVRFVFYLDAENHNMNCRLTARYGETELSVPFPEEAEHTQREPFRDMLREEETMFLARQWFPYWDSEKQELHCGQEDELMYRVMDKGVETLLALGEVQCTRRFTNVNIGRRVRMSVGISVSKDLLNLNIVTQDVPPEELLDILKSYRQKKKYHRLKNGDFLSLEEDASLQTLAEMMETLQMSPKELLKGNIKLPLYRALYLDKLLEKNEAIYSSRDSHFREMVKSFKTVNDADFEEPPSLAGVMRGYQKNGFRWLRTLEEYRLGGILADDMGLGKTLQMLALLLSAKLEGREGTSLVVTPASLVYNWGEEIRLYAPELKCEFITGTQEERREKLERYEEYDVIVTSYDLLKRDIDCYEDKKFRFQVIDEAQYIKNHTTAAAKAVKVIHSSVRYALTGTPIENRLSELWSIFDFLIPGYLYGYDVFRNEFEAPIVKNEDEGALERLQRMTSPFILRRLKENVLKDLPEKLEENRYVKFEQEQQTLYDAQVVRMRQHIVMQDAQEFQKNKIQILAELMRLRQICCDPALCFENYRGESAKLEACLDLVQSASESGHKILLFSQFTSMLEMIAKRMEEAKISFYTITGATPKEKRLQMVKAFNEDDTKVFLISLKAGGVGLNLTGADVVIHYDPWWNLAVQNQATDRTHRIGQTKVVVVYRLIAKGTIEEKIQELQESKKALSDQIIQGDASQLGGMSKEDFIALLS